MGPDIAVDDEEQDADDPNETVAPEGPKIKDNKETNSSVLGSKFSAG